MLTRKEMFDLGHEAREAEKLRNPKQLVIDAWHNRQLKADDDWAIGVWEQLEAAFRDLARLNVAEAYVSVQLSGGLIVRTTNPERKIQVTPTVPTKVEPTHDELATQTTAPFPQPAQALKKVLANQCPEFGISSMTSEDTLSESHPLVEIRVIWQYID